MSRRLRAEEGPATGPAELDKDPARHGGAYVDGARVEGPEPDYGFVDDGQGHRVPAGPDGKPRKAKE